MVVETEVIILLDSFLMFTRSNREMRQFLLLEHFLKRWLTKYSKLIEHRTQRWRFPVFTPKIYNKPQKSKERG